VGAPLTLSATATSGLTVAFNSTTTEVCTVSGTQATFITTGTCTIDANQAGNSTYAAAPMVPQSFTVNAAAPSVNLNPSPLVIAPLGVFHRGISFITLTNTGNATLSNIAFNLSGAYASQFAIDAYTGAQGETAGTCTGVTSLTAGSSCTIQVAFQPSNPGQFSAILSVSDNASNSPQTVTVTGTATLGQLQFYPALLNTYAGVIGLGNGCQDTGTSGPAVDAMLCHAESTATDLSGNTYISDLGMNVVYKVDSSGNMSVFAGNPSETGASGPGCAHQTNSLGDGCPATAATIGSPYGLAVDGFGNVYIADTGNKSIRVVNGQTGIITTFLGATNGSLTFGSNTVNFTPGGMSFDPSGNLYVTDYIAAVVLKVDTSGNYTIFAGVLTQQGYNGDNQPATSAELYQPTGVAADLYGNVYIADSQNNRIRKVDTSGNITTVAGNGTAGNTGDGGPAIAAEIYAGGVAVDVAGEFYFSTDGTSIRKVDLLGNITTIAGGGSGGTGGPAPSAKLFDAVNPGIDLAGDVLIPSDSGVAKAGPQGALAFGSMNVGSTSAAKTVTLINTGSSTLYFYSPSEETAVPGAPGRAAATTGARSGAAHPESGPGSGGSVYSVTGDFAIATGGTCNLTTSGSIAAGASCTVNVTFTPTQSGPRTGTLSFDLEDSNNEILSNTNVQLTGTGTSAELTAQTISFPNPGAQTAGTPLTLSATATSGLTVAFNSTTTEICTVSGTQATFITTGTCTIDANQAGNSTYAAAPMVPQSFTVNAAPVPSFTVTSPTAPQTVQHGGAAHYTINVNPVNGSYTGAVTLSASGLPTGATASFAPNPVTPGSAGAPSTLTIQTAALTASNIGSSWPLAVPALSLIGLFFVPGKRRRRWLMMGVLLLGSLGALTALSGCGGGFWLSTSTPYTITVNGANASGAIVSSTTVQLTVQ
jgi:sugar lactone lactonase YvrE